MHERVPREVLECVKTMNSSPYSTKLLPNSEVIQLIKKRAGHQLEKAFNGIFGLLNIYGKRLHIPTVTIDGKEVGPLEEWTIKEIKEEGKTQCL